MASNAEDFILRLKQQISGPAATATTALAQLDQRINAEKAALGGLEGKLAAASAKLQALGEGSNGRVSIAAIRRQQEAVTSLQAELDKTRGSIDSLEGARGLAEQADAMVAAAAAAKALEAAQQAEAAMAQQAAAAAEKVAAAAAKQAAAVQAAADAAAAAAARQAAADQAAADKAAAAFEATQAAVARGIAERTAMADAAAAASVRAASEAAGAEALEEAAADALAASQLRVAEAAYEAAESERKLTEQLTAAESAAESAAKKSAKASKGAGVNAGEFGESLSKLGGPLGQAGADVGRLGAGFQKLAALGPAGIVLAVVVAVVALGAALVTGAVALAQWAVGLADAARSQRLLADGIAGSVAGGAQLQEAITRLAGQVPIATDELRRMAADLAKTGLQGEALSKALEEAAIKAAKLKFGPDFAKEMLSLPRQAERLKANFAAVFGGLKIEGLLRAMSKLVALFDANTASGKALKLIFESLFQPLIDAATAAIPYVERAFLTLVLWALKARNALKPYEPELKALGVTLLVIAAVVGGVLLASFAALAVIVLSPILAFMLLRAAAGAAVDWIRGKLTELSTIGSDMMAALASGIIGAGAKVFGAISGVISGAIAQANAILQRHSPPKVFVDMGRDVSTGMAGGVDSEADSVAGATASMAQGAVSAGRGALAKGVGGGASKGGGHTFNFPNCIFGGDLTKDKLRGWMTEIMAEAEGELEPEPA